MLDSNGLIIDHDTQPPQVLFMEVDLGKLYGKPVGWDEFNNAIKLVSTYLTQLVKYAPYPRMR